jgi:hypothetical protein
MQRTLLEGLADVAFEPLGLTVLLTIAPRFDGTSILP